MLNGRKATATSPPDFSRAGSIRIAPMTRQQAVTPIAGTQRWTPETIFNSPSMATSSTNPSPPKKLTVVSVFSALVRSA